MNELQNEMVMRSALNACRPSLAVTLHFYTWEFRQDRNWSCSERCCCFCYISRAACWGAAGSFLRLSALLSRVCVCKGGWAGGTEVVNKPGPQPAVPENAVGSL